MRSVICLVCLCFILLQLCWAKKDERDCEVCIGVVKKVHSFITEKGIDVTVEDKVEQAIKDVCKNLRGKEEKICFYIGASPTSATYVVREMAKPITRHLPADKVCDSLRKKDAQLCETRYDKQIDWKTVDLNKLRVKELKKILEEWGEHCKGCTEKTEYVQKIIDLKPKYVREDL